MIEQLCAEGFAEMPRVREPYGVYLLLDRGTVIYVGQSTNIYARLARHKAAATQRRQRSIPPEDVRRHKAMIFDRVVVRWCLRSELDRVEIELIERFRPKYNEIHAGLGAARVDITAIAAKLGWNARRPRPIPGELRRRVA